MARQRFGGRSGDVGRHLPATRAVYPSPKSITKDVVDPDSEEMNLLLTNVLPMLSL